MNKTYTLSLSRWHKVAERLSRIYTETINSVSQTYNDTQISGYLGESQVARLKADAALEAMRLQRAFQLQDVLIHIRQAVGEANSKTGVANALAEYDALMRRCKVLERILLAQDSCMVGWDELANLPAHIVSEDRYDRSRATIRVRMLDQSAEDSLREMAEVLRARIYELTDRISDLNRERMALELPAEIAEAVGL